MCKPTKIVNSYNRLTKVKKKLLNKIIDYLL